MFPMTEILAQVTSIQRLIWFVAALVSLAVVTLTYFVAARVVRPVGKLTHAVEAIAAGDYRQHVHLKSEDELGTLAKYRVATKDCPFQSRPASRLRFIALLSRDSRTGRQTIPSNVPAITANNIAPRFTATTIPSHVLLG